MNEAEARNERNAEFYRDKTWQLVLERIDEIAREQRSQRQMIEEMNQKWRYVYGMAAGVTIVFSLVWQWVITKLRNVNLL